MSDGPTEAARLEREPDGGIRINGLRVEPEDVFPPLSPLLGQQVPGALQGRVFGHSTFPQALKDSGAREEMPTGSRRDTRVGKGRFDLLWRASAALTELAALFEAGAAKYGDRNWEKGQPLSRYLDSALRHLNRWAAGQTDENHLCQACWNLLAALETRARVRAGVLPAELEDVK